MQSLHRTPHSAVVKLRTALVQLIFIRLVNAMINSNHIYTCLFLSWSILPMSVGTFAHTPQLCPVHGWSELCSTFLSCTDATLPCSLNIKIIRYVLLSYILLMTMTSKIHAVSHINGPFTVLLRMLIGILISSTVSSVLMLKMYIYKCLSQHTDPHLSISTCIGLQYINVYEDCYVHLLGKVNFKL